jgi:hypothetical protein
LFSFLLLLLTWFFSSILHFLITMGLWQNLDLTASIFGDSAFGEMLALKWLLGMWELSPASHKLGIFPLLSLMNLISFSMLSLLAQAGSSHRCSFQFLRSMQLLILARYDFLQL